MSTPAGSSPARRGTTKSDEGIFGRTKVINPVFGGNRGWGAWQIAGRYDVIDLSDKSAAVDFAYGCSECGKQETWLIGLNWWLTDYTALKFHVQPVRDQGGTAAIPRAAASTETAVPISPASARGHKSTGNSELVSGV